MKRYGLLMALSLLFLSCDTSFFPLTSEVPLNPSPEEPRVLSYEKMNGIEVKWTADPLSDHFVLYRRIVDQAPLTALYVGTNTRYTDTSALPGQIYLYSLAKIRGQKEFPRSGEVPGAYNNLMVTDPQGSNSSGAAAVPLGSSRSDVILYTQGNDSVNSITYTVEDWDYFYYDIPARMTLDTIITYADGLGGSQFLSVGDGVFEGAYADEGTISFVNSSNTVQRVYIRVRFNTTSGATVPIPYTLKFSQLRANN